MLYSELQIQQKLASAATAYNAHVAASKNRIIRYPVRRVKLSFSALLVLSRSSHNYRNIEVSVEPDTPLFQKAPIGYQENYR